MENADIVVTRDEAFTDGARPLLWDSYVPRDGGNGDVVLVLHGGGWRVGNRGEMAKAATAIARRGFTAIAPEYRLLGEAPWPTPIQDVCSAIRAVLSRNMAKRVFIVGYSAGAALALLVASAPELAGEFSHVDEFGAGAVAAVAAFFPMARLAPRHMEGLGLDEEGLIRFSAETHAAKLPPTIIFCGEADKVTPAEISISLRDKIIAAGGVADLRLYAGLVHEFVCLPGMMDLTIADISAFFDRTVRGKAAFKEACSELDAWWKSAIEGNILPMPSWD